jgi:hypothetical protein
MQEVMQETEVQVLTTDEILNLVCPSYQVLDYDGRRITSRVINVTPEIARVLLDRNTHNRKIAKGHVTFLVKEIKNGDWKFGGEPIKIDSNGVLIDGQHRLLAIIAANTQIPMLVLSGIDPTAFSVLDTGRKRLGGDALGIHGVENSTLVAAAIKLIVHTNRGSYGETGASNRTLSNDDLIRFYDENPEIIEAANKGKRLNTESYKLLAPSIIAAFSFILSKISESDADEFLEKLCVGVELEAGSPIMQLRQKLHISNSDARKRLKQSEIISYIILVWNMYRAGETTKFLRLPEEKVVLEGTTNE